MLSLLPLNSHEEVALMGQSGACHRIDRHDVSGAGTGGEPVSQQLCTHCQCLAESVNSFHLCQVGSDVLT